MFNCMQEQKKHNYIAPLRFDNCMIGSIIAATTKATVEPIIIKITGSIILEIPATAVSTSSS